MIEIILGHKCNMRCTYCLQYKGDDTIPEVSDEEFENFLPGIVDFIMKQNDTKIAYWGGEPFLYWDRIKKIQSALNSIDRKFDLVMFNTNATLVTEEIVDELLTWKNCTISFIVSPHEELERKRIPWDVLSRLPNISLSYLVTHRRMDISAFENYHLELEAKLGRKLGAAIFGVKHIGSCEDADALTQEDLNSYYAQLQKLQMDAIRDTESFGHRIFQTHMNLHIPHWQPELTDTYAGEYYLKRIDLRGNLHFNHSNANDYTNYYNIFTEEFVDDFLERKKFHTRFPKEFNCSACNRNNKYHICHGVVAVSKSIELSCIVYQIMGHLCYEFIDLFKCAEIDLTDNLYFDLTTSRICDKSTNRQIPPIVKYTHYVPNLCIAKDKGFEMPPYANPLEHLTSVAIYRLSHLHFPLAYFAGREMHEKCRNCPVVSLCRGGMNPTTNCQSSSSYNAFCIALENAITVVYGISVKLPRKD